MGVACFWFVCVLVFLLVSFFWGNLISILLKFQLLTDHVSHLSGNAGKKARFSAYTFSSYFLKKMRFYQVYLLQKVLYQTLSEEKSIPNKIRQKPLPKKHWKKQSTKNSEISIKTMSEKPLPTHLRTKMFRKNLRTKFGRTNYSNKTLKRT